MLKPFINLFNKTTAVALLFSVSSVFALQADNKEDFILDGDNLINLPTVKNGLTQVKFWGNVTIEQGSLKIKADEAIVYSGKEGISKVTLTGNQVNMQQIIDEEYGKIDVTANKIDYLIKQETLEMTGKVVIISKIQGEMSGEKITMNLKTKEIKGEKTTNGRVRLTIKPKK